MQENALFFLEGNQLNSELPRTSGINGRLKKEIKRLNETLLGKKKIRKVTLG